MKFGDVRCKVRDKTRALSGGTFHYRLRTGESISVHCSYVALYNIRLNITSSSHTHVLGSWVSHICTSVIKIQTYRGHAHVAVDSRLKQTHVPDPPLSLEHFRGLISDNTNAINHL